MNKLAWRLRPMGETLQMSVPSRAQMSVGEHVLYYDPGKFLLVVPLGTVVDEGRLKKAVKLPIENTPD